MKQILKRACAIFLAGCLSLSLVSLAANDDPVVTFSLEDTYPDGRIVFSGMELREGANGEIQALLNVSVRNIEANSVAFILDYDMRYLEVSNFDTNADCAPGEKREVYFREDPAYPAGTFKSAVIDDELGEMGGELFGQVGEAVAADRGIVSLALMVEDTADTTDCDYLKQLPGFIKPPVVLDALNRTIPLGQLSFRLLQPEKMTEMTPGELTQLLKIYEKDVTTSLGTTIHQEYALLFYYDTQGLDGEYMGREYAEFDLNFDRRLVSVKSVPYTDTVLAPELYETGGTGTASDLPAGLNDGRQTVELRYSDNSRDYDGVVWGGEGWEWAKLDESGGETGEAYDPRSGAYRVSQPYLDTGILARSELTIQPVAVEEIVIEDQELTYTVDPDQRPGTYDALLLAHQGSPVLDHLVPGLTLPQVSLSGWQPDVLPTNFTAEIPDPASKLYGVHDFTISGVDLAAAPTITAEGTATGPVLTALYPWLTVAPLDVTATRIIGERTAPVTSAAAKVDGPTGVLTLQVTRTEPFINDPESTDGEGVVTPGAQTSFTIKLPSGAVLDQSRFDEGKLAVTFGQDLTTATITVDPSGAGAYLSMVRQCFNLGGTFKVAARDPGDPPKGLSKYAVAESAARENVYLPPETPADAAAPGAYVFDYTGDQWSKFPVYQDDVLGTRLTLPAGSEIRLRYDGATGAEPGAVRRITLTGWKSGVPLDLGVTTASGVLEERDYGYERRVLNPPTPESGDAPTVSLVLKLEARARGEDTDERIAPIEDFVFDTVYHNGGNYDTQTQTFTITNTGKDTIYGLHIQPDSLFDTSFSLVSQPAEELAPGAKTTFAVSTKASLDVADYASSFSICTNRTASLKVVKLAFKVSSFQVFRITPLTNDPDMGSLTVVGSQTYEASRPGELVTVKLRATPMLYHALVEGEQGLLEVQKPLEGEREYTPYGPGAVTLQRELPDENDVVTATFTMPDTGRDIWISAVFEENLFFRLRLENLRLLENASDPGTGAPHALQVWDEETGVFRSAPFDAQSDRYRALLPVGQELPVVLELTLANAKIKDEGDIRVSVEHKRVDGETVTPEDALTTTIRAGQERIYDGAALPVDTAMPVFQRLEITISHVPSGTEVVQEQRTYTLDLCQTLAPEPAMAYGNAPFGRIMADAGIAAGDKQAAKAAFTAAADGKPAFAFPTTPGLSPAGADFTVCYTPEAWGGGLEDSAGRTPVSPQAVTQNADGSDTVPDGQYLNFDMDETALFVTSGTALIEPGLSPVDSLGAAVAPEDVAVTLTVRTMTEDPASAGYDLRSDVRDAAETQLTGTLDQGGLAGFQTLRVLPGRYQMVYTYFDSVLDADVRFFRNVIVLAPAGDTNLSGRADQTDQDLLDGGLKHPLPYTLSTGEYAGRLVYQYRVCDVTGDRNVNHLDANAIRAGAAKSLYP